jgi:hypothetical protein
MWLTQLRKRWLDTSVTTTRSRSARARPRVRQLEDRTVPTLFTIANGDVAGLIAAVKTANGDGQVDTILLAQNGEYDFGPPDNHTHGNNYLPVITSASLIIDGNGSRLVPANGSTIAEASRFLYLSPSANLVLENVSLVAGETLGSKFDQGAASTTPAAL